jgi:hypothetical protein
MKAPKHRVRYHVRPTTALTRLHTAFIKSVALGEPPTRAASRLAKNPDHATQLLMRFTTDPATLHAIKAEVELLLIVYALPIAMATILETLKHGGKNAFDAAKLVLRLNRERIHAANNRAKRGGADTPREIEALQSAISLARAKLAQLDAAKLAERT